MKIAFDYTERSEPLEIRQIKRDCDELWTTRSLCPDKIILWQHQLDWIIKSVSPELVAPHLGAGERIWGIPLEVRE